MRFIEHILVTYYRRTSARVLAAAHPSVDRTSYPSKSSRHKIFIRTIVQHVSAPSNPSAGPSKSLSNGLQPSDLLDIYRGLIARGDILYDEDQMRVVMRLRNLSKSLENYTPNLISGHAVPVITAGASWWTSLYPLPEESRIPPSKDSRALLLRKDAAREMEELPFPKGVILIAPPGRGKTFLLDLWFSTLPTKHKVRKHYSTLVLEMYRALWEETQHRARVARIHRNEGWTPESVAGQVKWTSKLKQQWKTLFQKGDMDGMWNKVDPRSVLTPESNRYVSPLPISQTLAARLLLRQGYVLHIDELQLLDIGSATILSDVLAHYWRMGGLVVATSNKVPGELYKNGLGAERVRGFVSALEARCEVVRVGGEVDWRRAEDGSEDSGARKNWFLNEKDGGFQQAVDDIVQGRTATPVTLTIFSRSFHIPVTYPPSTSPSLSPVAQVSFDEVCNTALGTADYATLASTFPTIIITDIPILRLSTKDRARRFISLIDALYEARVKILCSAEADIDGLFFPDELGGELADGGGNERTMMEEALSEGSVVYRPNVSSYQPQEETKASPERRTSESSGKEGLSLKELSIFTGQEEKFAYARATSRLVQMTSAKYAATAVWQPLTRAQQPWYIDQTQTPPAPLTSAMTPDFAADITGSVDHQDWAEEASYDAQRGRIGRPEPPRLSENHAWGVRDDWGKGAGEWGKGVNGRKKR